MPTPARLPDVIPLTDLEQDAVSILERLRHSGSPTIITQEGRATAVLVDIEAFRRAESEREILALLARGERKSLRKPDTTSVKCWPTRIDSSSGESPVHALWTCRVPESSSCG